MVLDSKINKKIVEFVSAKPRTIDEISKFINKNWRTADRYVEKICKQDGSLAIRVFRAGTRGALKIVFCPTIDHIHSARFQECLFEMIRTGKNKHDFNPLDIYQYIDQKKRASFLEEFDGTATTSQKLIHLLNSAEEQILILSGNLSWMNLIDGKKKVVDALKKVIKRGVSVKILTRVDIATLKNFRMIRQLSEDTGKEISIRHREHPLRCFIIDDKIARLKEVKVPDTYKKGELKHETTIYYDLLDKEWVEWLQKVFWNLYSTSITADKRIKALESVSKLL